MHRPSTIITTLTLFTLLAAANSTALAEAPHGSSAQGKQRKFLPFDLFPALTGSKGGVDASKAPPARVADRSSAALSSITPGSYRSRSGSVLSGGASGMDAIESLAGPVPELSAKTPASSKPSGPARRPGFSEQDIARDLISSTADSRDTGASENEIEEEPRVAIKPNGAATSPPRRAAHPQGANEFATAADAARRFSQPTGGGDLLDIEPASPREVANATSTPAAAPKETPEVGPVAVVDRQTEPTPTMADDPAATSSAQAEQVFAAGDAPTLQKETPDKSAETEAWISADSNHSTTLPAGTSFSSTESSVSSHSIAGRNNVLVTEQLPLVTSQVTGPSKILIGREAKYRVTIENRGSADAKQLTTEVESPEWADLVHTIASSGGVQRTEVSGARRVLRWEMDSLAAGQSQTLDVVLVPRTSQPLSLGVSWRHAPVNSTTLVEVQEPKLNMALSGPDEVFFGRAQTYRLTITNPGTGAAENVLVQLMPPGGGQAVSNYRVDSLAPGEAKVVDVEITAREPGDLSIRALAAADGDLHAEASQQIFCRHAELSVDWRGPQRKFAGTQATYFFRVRNPGTAAADQVEFEVALPPGFEFASASDGYRYDESGRRVNWKVGALRPGDDCYLELRGIVNQAGANELRILARNVDSDVQDSKVAQTEVVALADLKLDVLDPKGPIPVGSEVDYEIVVTNRGRSTCEEVNIVGLFSAGIEPLGAEGGQATITDGRVGFNTIGALPAGQKLRLKIRARAQSEGTHLFRTEVVCRDLEIKLAAEETTRFYQDDSPRGSNGNPLESASRASRFEQVR